MAWKACKNRVTAGITELCEVRWWVPTDLRDRFSRTGALFLPIGHKSRHNGVAQTKKRAAAGRPIKTAILDGKSRPSFLPPASLPEGRSAAAEALSGALRQTCLL